MLNYDKFKIKLSDIERKERELLFSNLISNYYQSINPRLTKIREWRDMYDQEVTDTDWPWEGAIRAKLAVVPLAIKSIKGKVHRMFWKSDKIIKCSTDNKALSQYIAEVENWANHTIKHKVRIAEQMGDVEFNALEDGTGIGEVVYVEERKRAKSAKKYAKIEDFNLEFPTAKDAGLDEDKYNSYVGKLKKGEQVEAPGLYDKLISSGPKVRCYEREDFIILPAEAIDIEYARGVGGRYIISENEIKEKVDESIFDDIDVGGGRKNWQTVSSIGGTTTPEEQQQETRTGVQKSNLEQVREEKKGKTGYDRDFYAVNLIWRDKLGNDKKARDYWYTLIINPGMNHCVIMNITEDHYNHGQRRFSRVLWEKRKSKQFDGTSVPYMLRHIDNIGERALSLWFANWEIRSSPVIAHKDTINDDILDSWEIKPGKHWKMKDPQADVNVLDIGGSAEPDSMTLVLHQEKMAELIVGIGAYQSGREAPGDPTAPASKTAMLMRAGNERIMDGANTMLETGVNRIVKQCLMLSAQYKENASEYISEYKEGKPEYKTLSDEIIAKLEEFNFEVDFEVATAEANRQADKSEFLELMSIEYKSDPDMQQDPFMRAKFRNYMFSLFESPLRHELNLTDEQIEARQARILAKAMAMREQEQSQQSTVMDSKVSQLVKEERLNGKAKGLNEEQIKKNIMNKLTEIDQQMAESAVVEPGVK